jgi:hypothetical protein
MRLQGRKVLFLVLMVFCTIGMGYLPAAYKTVTGHITYFYLIVAAAAAFGAFPLLRIVGERNASKTRTLARLVLAYLLVEALAVIPVAVWMNVMSVNTIIGAMMVRFVWMLGPAMVALLVEDDTREWIGRMVVVAAAVLTVWAVFSAATGGGGYYLEDGVQRWRALTLGGGGLLLAAWPWALAVSRAVPRRWAWVLAATAVVGIALTNSRSGIISFALAGLLGLALTGHLKQFLAWALPLLGAMVVAVLLWGQRLSGPFGYTLTHLFDISSGNGADRLMRWRLAWEFFVTHPINDYVWTWRYYLVFVSDLYQPHNFVLEVAITEGIAGLMFYVTTFSSAARGAFAAARADWQVRALVCYLVAYLAFCFQNAAWYLPVTMPMLVLAVTALAVRVDQLHAGAVARA